MKNKLLRRVVFGLVTSIMVLAFSVGVSGYCGDAEYLNYSYEDYDYEAYENYKYEDYDYEEYSYEKYYKDYDYEDYYKELYSIILDVFELLFERFPALENAFASIF